MNVCMYVRILLLIFPLLLLRDHRPYIIVQFHVKTKYCKTMGSHKIHVVFCILQFYLPFNDYMFFLA
jgi:hypothetical protein